MRCAVSPVLLSVAALLLPVSCAGRGGSPPKPSGDPGGGTGSVDYSKDVQPILDAACSCHLTLAAPEGLVLLKGLSYDAIVGKPSNQIPTLDLVKPLDPAASYFFLKVDPSPASSAGRTGALMPTTPPALSAAEVDVISRWIVQGALRSGPVKDTTPPVFVGARSAVAADSSSIDLSWTAAMDGTSGPSDIDYLVYAALSSGAQAFATPDVITLKGALTVRVGGLLPATTYFFVVRARDAAGNIGANVTEVSATTLPQGQTLVDFDLQVLPIFQRDCVRCHGSASGLCAGSAGLCLDCGDAVENAVTSGRIVRGNSGASLLLQRIRGDVPPPMPLDGPPYLSEAEVALIATWIDEGAARASPPGGNRAPAVHAGGPYEGYAGEPIAFAAREAYDADCDALTLAWDFGDGTTGTGRFPRHTYAAEGLYTAILTAWDGTAQSQVAAAAVTVLSPGSGFFPKSAAVQKACAGCHGLRITLEDGRRGMAAGPGGGTEFFPAGIVLDARARTAAAWHDTVSRMKTYGTVITDPERTAIETFLSSSYGSTDVRTETVRRICSPCHSPTLSAAATRLPGQWRETVARMRTYGASFTALEERATGDWLGEVYGGPPPAALDMEVGRALVGRTCSPCHTVARFLDASTGLPLAGYRIHEGARALAGKMLFDGCGQKGVTDEIAARWLAEVTAASPALLWIEAYSWSAATQILSVKAWSSVPTAALSVLAEDGRILPMLTTGDGTYTLNQAGVGTSFGRIAVFSSSKSYLAWTGPVPQ